MYPYPALTGGRGGAEPRPLPPRRPPGGRAAGADPAAANLVFPVYLVEPARPLRIAATRDLTASGYETRPFASVDDLAGAIPELAPGCVVADAGALDSIAQALREPGQDDRLRFPTILLFSALDTDHAIAAVRIGVADLLRRPAPLPDLLAALRRAAPRVQDLRLRIAEAEARQLIESLSVRERQVMECMMLGFSNKEMARALGVSHRTIEMHRRRLHRRLGTGSLAELLAVAWRARRGEGGFR